MPNWLKRFFLGPALDVVLDIALARVKNKIADKDLPESEKMLANELLELFSKEILSELSKQ